MVRGICIEEYADRKKLGKDNRSTKQAIWRNEKQLSSTGIKN